MTANNGITVQQFARMLAPLTRVRRSYASSQKNINGFKLVLLGQKNLLVSLCHSLAMQETLTFAVINHTEFIYPRSLQVPRLNQPFI